MNANRENDYQVVQEPVRAEDLKHANGVAVIPNGDADDRRAERADEGQTETPTQEG